MTAYRAEIHDTPDAPAGQVFVFDARSGVEACQMTQAIVDRQQGRWADLDVDDETGQWLPYQRIGCGR